MNDAHVKSTDDDAISTRHLTPTDIKATAARDDA